MRITFVTKKQFLRKWNKSHQGEFEYDLNNFLQGQLIQFGKYHNKYFKLMETPYNPIGLEITARYMDRIKDLMDKKRNAKN
jgi:hypothetical protein